MPGFLKQSTASQSRSFGPFIDDTDFKTLKTGLSIGNTDIKLIINGGGSVNKNSGGGTHRVNGVYGVTFDATDTATVGEMEVNALASGALIVFDKFIILEEAVYDALFAANAPGYGTAQTGDSYAVVNSGTFGNAAIKTETASIQADTNDIQTRLPAALSGGLMMSTIASNVKQNQALANIPFVMIDNVPGQGYPLPGLTVTIVRKIDSGAFGAGGLSAVTETGDGWYRVDAAQADMNGKEISFRATATGASDCNFTYITTP